VALFSGHGVYLKRNKNYILPGFPNTLGKLSWTCLPCPPEDHARENDNTGAGPSSFVQTGTADRDALSIKSAGR